MARSTKTAQQKAPSKADRERAAKALSSVGHPLALPVELQRAFFRNVDGILRQPSLAYWKDRTLSKMMRNDPDIEAPLHNMQVSVAGLEWEVRPTDDGQDEIVEFVDDALRAVEQFADLRMQLLEAVWYGPSAANLIWKADANGTVPLRWVPIHSDTLSFTRDGNLGLRVGSEYLRQHPDEKLSRGFDSWVRLLSPTEQEQVALHVYRRRGPDFDVANESAYHYAGRGVRDVAWFYWMMKQEALQNWATYCSRYAMGVRIGYYQAGNLQAKSDMETVLRNLVGDVSAVLPRESPDQKSSEIEILEPTAGRAVVFGDLTDWLSSNIEVLIQGQRLTTGVHSTGMGSGVADQHAKTFNRHLTYITRGLDETLTREVVRKIVDRNFGPQEKYPQFWSNVPNPDGPAILDAAQKFVSIGGEVKADQLRGVLGLTRPEAGDEVLSQANMLPGFGTGGGLSHPNQMGSMADGEGMERVSARGLMGGGKDKGKGKAKGTK